MSNSPLQTWPKLVYFVQRGLKLRFGEIKKSKCQAEAAKVVKN